MIYGTKIVVQKQHQRLEAYTFKIFERIKKIRSRFVESLFLAQISYQILNLPLKIVPSLTVA